MFTQMKTCLLGIGIVTLLVGCESQPITESGEQESLGRGIVIGTLGTQQDEMGEVDFSSKVAGQVMKIEGGAYIVREYSGQEIRLPLDENTSIDRPAHVGDNLEAYLDPEGRAKRIRNIDEVEGGE